MPNADPVSSGIWALLLSFHSTCHFFRLQELYTIAFLVVYLISKLSSSYLISGRDSRTRSSKFHRPMLGRMEEAVRGGCPSSESIFNFNIKKMEKEEMGIFNALV